MQNITIHLEAFEGPFDLLFHLIEKNEIDIYDIPIAKLTEQYLEYLENASNPNMDGMSEFLVMAATLLEIKSKLLLPLLKNKEEALEQDPREALVEKLLEYKRFKNITDDLKERRQTAEQVLYKDADQGLSLLKQYKKPEGIEEMLHGITMEDIYKAFEDVMRRKEVKVDKVRSGFKSVERDLYTIEEKIAYIKDLLILSPKIEFHSIFRSSVKKMEIVVTFLALLELMKWKQITVSQKSVFDEIIITKYSERDIK